VDERLVDSIIKETIFNEEVINNVWNNCSQERLNGTGKNLYVPTTNGATMLNVHEFEWTRGW
jgi:hypothetical protein